MLYPQKQERAHRFMLALRTGLPLFSLATILTFARLSEYFHQIPEGFFIVAIFILAVSIYFIFYMIYRGFDEQITDPITHTFTRQKVVSLLKKDIAKYKEYSIVLINIENLFDINARYGTTAGDKVLKQVAIEAGNYFLDKGFEKFPVGHFKGGDFLLGLKGNQNTVKPFLEMMSIKFDDFIVNDIEVKINAAIVDKSLGDDAESLIERLFELKASETEEAVHFKTFLDNEDLSILELEKNVIYAIKNRTFSLMFQPVAAKDKIAQVSIKLQDKNFKIIHQKSFIPVVKRLGYEREYNEIVLEKVLNVCNKTEGVSFAFNLSPSVLRNRRFFQRFKQMVEGAKIDYARLLVILSEKEVYTNMNRYNDLLQEYRALSVRFILDDVGSLNASVEYIKRLKVDIIRFEKSFSKYIDSPAYIPLLSAYIKMCEEMGMKSWMKMVDTQELKDLSEEMNIDYIQGNIVSKIINYNKLEEVL